VRPSQARASARLPPARWASPLPDLASRLRATTAVGLRPAEEPLLRALLARLLSERQLLLGESLQDWLLARLPRHPAALREAVARLDRTAMAAGRRVNRAMAAGLIAAMTGDQGDGSDNSASELSTKEPVLL
jgi:chromosomal replication initiation ATPase DnaA